MITFPHLTTPAPAAESPPEKKSARPLARDEQRIRSTDGSAAQDPGQRARREFLSDVRRSDPALWATVEWNGGCSHE